MKEILYEKIEQGFLEKEYRPDKARKIAEWSSADHSGSLRNDTETLYIKGTGEYFIVYEGGLSARFHELPGVSTWFGGSYTRPVTEEEAYDWCRETDNLDAINENGPFFIKSLKT